MNTKKLDIADFLNTKGAIVDALSLAIEDNDTEFLFAIIGALARSKGMTEIAAELGVTREGLYKSLGPAGNPSFVTVMKLLRILGLGLTVKNYPTLPHSDPGSGAENADDVAAPAA